MGLVVQKYGGTSMASPERIAKSARFVIAAREEGHDVVVVVSAMAGETNRLLALADSIDANGSPRERDMLAASGEQVSIALMAMTLHKAGYSAISLLGSQVGIFTDDAFAKARIKHIEEARIRKELEAGHVVVIAGFQGITDEGDIATLGRGGSDTSAVALAAALKADYCDIFTDVDGVYAADPRIVPKAKKIERISYEEMLELSKLGAKVLHGRSVEFAMKYKVPLRVRSSFEDLPGTWVA
jgi:aspartate kinase